MRPSSATSCRARAASMSASASRQPACSSSGSRPPSQLACFSRGLPSRFLSATKKPSQTMAVLIPASEICGSRSAARLRSFTRTR